MSVLAVNLCSHCLLRVPDRCDGKVYEYDGRELKIQAVRPVKACRGSHAINDATGDVFIRVVRGQGDVHWYPALSNEPK